MRFVRFHRYAALAASFMIALAPITAAMPDLKIAVKYTTPNYSALGRQTTTYVQNDRKRVEERERHPQALRPGLLAGRVVYPLAPSIVTITRCDLDQIFTLNLDDREYTSMPVPEPPTKEETQARAGQARQAYEHARQRNPAIPPMPTMPAQPNLLIEITTKDTGERKQMFGFTARHVITTQKQTPLIETDETSDDENVTDGWYTDLDTSVPCDRPPAGTFGVLTVGSASIGKKGEPPQYPVATFKFTGSPERGFALTAKKRFHVAAMPGLPARDIVADESQVTELSMTPLDPALFEIPKNFHKVPQIRRAAAVSFWQRTLGWLNYYWVRFKRAIHGYELAILRTYANSPLSQNLKEAVTKGGRYI